MTRAAGQLDRSLEALTLGLQKGQGKREQAGSAASGEYEQQVQVPLSGVATAAWGFVDKNVTWRLPFLFAPMQRSVPFETPHFSSAIELTQPTNQLVVIVAHLTGWTKNPQGWYVGASIRFACHAPTAGIDEQNPFSAIAHLTFQGYASFPGGDK